MNTATYKSAGVDLDKYQQAMQKLPGFLRKTHETQPGRVMELSGGFAGLFRLNGGGNSYHDPVLVSGTDGVGTKIKVAQMASVYNTIGIDLVAMCVNDCLCLGAEPLFFLDYLAFGRDNPDLIGQLVEGVAEGCTRSQSALLGGETAIMPGLYAGDDFDMAGFSVGVVERDRIIDGSDIQPDDVILGLESSGLHSNGFSLVRQAVFDIGGLSLDDVVPEIGKSVRDALLEPTRIYTKALSAVMQHPRGVVGVNGIAHITGGGLQENIDRILPDGRRAQIDRAKWTVPPVFTWLQELGGIDTEEMFRVFNMGIGMAMVVRSLQLDAIVQQLSECGVSAHAIGEIVEV
jgi:phosphoribosylformylglycinamidine cyclo-ligase